MIIVQRRSVMSFACKKLTEAQDATRPKIMRSECIVWKYVKKLYVWHWYQRSFKDNSTESRYRINTNHKMRSLNLD